jgi:hypothetical protein
MNMFEARRSFDRLGSEEKLHFLSSLAHRLTVDTRGVLMESHPRSADVLCALNEMQHDITSALLILTGKEPARFSSERLWMTLEARAAPLRPHDWLAERLERAFQSVSSPAQV